MDALGYQTRRDILALLKDSPRPVGEIADLLPVSRPAVSRHLRILEQAGLVQHVSAGTRHIFQLRLAGFETARSYMESFWEQALQNFSRIAEENPRL